MVILSRNVHSIVLIVSKLVTLVVRDLNQLLFSQFMLNYRTKMSVGQKGIWNYFLDLLDMLQIRMTYKRPVSCQIIGPLE